MRIVKIAFVMFVFSGCGGDYKVHVDDVEVVHTISITSVEKYVSAYCREEYGTSVEEVETCVNAEMGQLVRSIN
jgi:hypothetical protein